MPDGPAAPLASTRDQQADKDGRLPANVKPTHYDLTLAINLKDSKFSGEVIISLDVLEESRSITLHSNDLEIHDTRVQSGDKSIGVTDVSHNDAAQTTTVNLEDTLPVGNQVTLKIDFSGVFRDATTSGIYRDSYTTHTGSKEYIMTSQMEATECRRAFPCFDEPALKATFTTTMIADKDLTCLTNMDVRHTEIRDDGQKVWTFNTTPLMSTYILAFAAGKFNVIESRSFRVPISIYATPNHDVENGRFALDIAARTMEFFEGKLGLPYPLPKLDLLTVPSMLGAMENWGLVTFRDSILIFDLKTIESATIQLHVNFIHHELAHQWFGNIVTMEYWDGLWLNESFATWAAFYAGNAFFPDWKPWQTHLAEEYTRAFALDSLRSSHQIEVPVKSENEISQIFDAISYSKGSCVLRMISRFIGEETFLKGVGDYLVKHKYANTSTDDLWNALANASGKDVKSFGDIWTRKVGHPVLTVTEDEDTVYVRQNRFLRAGNVKDAEDTTLYPIFLGLRTSNGIGDTQTFTQRDIAIKKTGDFFKINADHASLYRTLYTSERLVKLVAAKAKLSPEDRYGLVTDGTALASAGYQKTTQTLWLLNELGDDSEYIVWRGIVDALRNISVAWAFEGLPVREALNDWQQHLVGPKAHELGWDLKDTDSYSEKQLKRLIFDAAVGFEDERTVKAALDMFAKFKDGDRYAINPNLRNTVYSAAVMYSEKPEEAFNAILNEYRAARPGSERQDALAALGSARQAELIQRTLQLLLTDEVSVSEILYPLQKLCRSAQGLHAVKEWLLKNYDPVEKKFGDGLSGMGLLLGICVDGLASEHLLKEVEDFFRARPSEKIDKQLAQSFEEARVMIDWVQRDRKDVEQWLQQQQSN